MIRRGMSTATAMRVLEVTLCCSIVVVFAAILLASLRGRAADGRLKDNLIMLCRRVNANAGYVNRLNEVTKAGLRPIVIADCGAIVK